MATSKEIKENLRGLNLLKVVLSNVLNNTDDRILNKKASVRDMYNILLDAVNSSTEYTKKVFSDKFPNSYSIEFEDDRLSGSEKTILYDSEFNPLYDSNQEDLNMIKNRLLNQLYSIDNRNLYGVWIYNHANSKNQIDRLNIIYIYINDTKQLMLANDVFNKTSNGNKFRSKTYNVSIDNFEDAMNSLIINNAGVDANNSKLLNSNAGEFLFNINKEVIDETIDCESVVYTHFNESLVFYPTNKMNKIEHLLKMLKD